MKPARKLKRDAGDVHRVRHPRSLRSDQWPSDPGFTELRRRSRRALLVYRCHKDKSCQKHPAAHGLPYLCALWFMKPMEQEHL